MFKKNKKVLYNSWICIYESTSVYQMELIHKAFIEHRVPSVILNQRDSAYNLNVGKMAQIFLYIPKKYETTAKELLNLWLDKNKKYIL